jgi:hypothetical protein
MREAGTPEQTRRRVEKDSSAARRQKLDLVSRDIRAGDGLDVWPQAADLLKQFDLPNTAPEMTRDHKIELG